MVPPQIVGVASKFRAQVHIRNPLPEILDPPLHPVDIIKMCVHVPCGDGDLGR